MASALEILKKLESINVDTAAAKAIQGTEPVYEALLKDQLLHGKGSDGEDLKPGYLEDPYFKTREAAQRYSDWKFKISPSVGRNPNAPNLYISGFYHSTVDIRADNNGILSTAGANFAGDIESKYNGKANILGGEYRTNYVFNTVNPKFIQAIKDYLK